MRSLPWQGIANPMVVQVRRKQVAEVQKLLPPILQGIKGFPDSVQLFQRRTSAILRRLENNWANDDWWWARWFMLVGQQQLWVKSAESWESRRLYPHLPPNHLSPPFAHTQVKLVFRSPKSFCSFACFPRTFCPFSVLFVPSLSLPCPAEVFIL